MLIPALKWSVMKCRNPSPEVLTLFATGPLTSDGLTKWIETTTSTEDLYFYDAIAPIVDAATIDMDHAFLANRYDKGDEAAYLNCPLTQPEYEVFIDALLAGEKVQPKRFEKKNSSRVANPLNRSPPPAATAYDLAP